MPGNFMMTLRAELSQLSANQFVALILDNEVTVGHFVTTPLASRLSSWILMYDL